MSRLEFRAPVGAPRPSSAWIMVLTASATLWITRQLPVWVMAAQAVAMATSLFARRRPHPWQLSPIALNAGMIAIVVATIAVASKGSPSSVALAHFAALTQGLQLIDARPRRSEFLLVALALFQVLLASSLTDSVLFVPLLACFVIATSWTLIVHTLRTEALEAGRPRAVTRAITPGLLRTTLLASSASIALALVLFATLPRLHSSFSARAGLGASGAMVGFSDRVRLGDLGRIRQDRSVVMRVETLEGRPPPRLEAYWRGLAFDHFDGRTWSVTPRTKRLLARDAELGIGFAGRQAPNLVQQIVQEPVASGVLFRVGEPTSLRGALGPLEADVNGGVYAPTRSHARLRYTISTQYSVWSDAELQRDRIAPPASDPERFLFLPEPDPTLERLALEILASQPTDADRVRAMERHLRRTGRYSDTPPAVDLEGPVSPVKAFLLGERAGHCEYFASAMVVLARSVGIPARLVNGFAGGESNPVGGFVELTRADAHAWVEVHYEKAGWVSYDPTPPDLRLRAASGSLWNQLRSLGSAFELWWFQRVVDFDRADQLHALKAGWLAWRRFQPAQRPDRQRSGPAIADWREGRAMLLRIAAAATLGLVGVWGVRRLLRVRRAEVELPSGYARALRLLRRRGLIRAPTATAWDFAARVREALSPEAATSFDVLTRAYLEARFGSQTASPLRGEYRRFRHSLRSRAHSLPASISQQRSSG